MRIISMSVGNRFWPAVVLAAALAVPAQADSWVISQAGGSTIEMPEFFANGATRAVIIEGQPSGVAYEPSRSISLKQYQVKTSSRPYAYLGIKFGLREINYSVNEMGRGVASGNDRRGSGFYATCRRAPGALVCIELTYDANLQSDYAPMIARIARSFAKDTQP
jgi:hypothetical protein